MRRPSASIPPCADPGFDHRTCDYWEDADRGSKAARLAGSNPTAAPEPPPPRRRQQPVPGDPDEPSRSSTRSPRGRADGPAFNPLRGRRRRAGRQPVRAASGRRGRPSGADAPRKLGLLGRGLTVFGSYAKVLLVDDVAVAYAQFGPLSAYPRALRLRELYPQLPDAPLPAVITCIATTAEARGAGHAQRLVEAVCDDLAERGFAAVEAYPEVGARPDATSARDTGVLADGRVPTRRRRRALPGRPPRARLMGRRRPDVPDPGPGESSRRSAAR